MNYYNFYFIVEKIIIELNNIFETYNKIVKLNIKFYIVDFVISVKNKKKFFEIFYIHFNIIIVLLNYSNIFKIFNLKCLINI